MSRLLRLVFAALVIATASTGAATDPEPIAAPDEPLKLHWYTSYAESVDAARQEGKMLLICFHRPGPSRTCEALSAEALAEANVARRLQRFVRARLPLDATLTTEQGATRLLDQPAFAEMRGRPGIAILDFAHADAPYYGFVVSALPVLHGRPYTARQMAAILDLPPGTLTQRTLIYAVRTHPERPASSEGEFSPYLAEEARRHSQQQARLRRQGHHDWGQRFHRINANLPPGLSACEVCAESWPGESLVEAAIECVRCWRSSSGHWRKVHEQHPVYGYDMQRGSNGVWYATGIFGRGSLAPATAERSPARPAALEPYSS